MWTVNKWRIENFWKVHSSCIVVHSSLPHERKARMESSMNLRIFPLGWWLLLFLWKVSLQVNTPNFPTDIREKIFQHQRVKLHEINLWMKFIAIQWYKGKTKWPFDIWTSIISVRCWFIYINLKSKIVKWGELLEVDFLTVSVASRE